MPSNKYTKNGMIYDDYGAIESYRESPNDKSYAVIVKSGHCGNGYYIPIMYGIVAKDLETAIKVAKIRPRVKRESTTAVLDAFEITLPQRLFIDAVNSRDPYLKYNLKPDDDYLLSRRVARPRPMQYKNKPDREDFIDKQGIIERAGDDYADRDVLQRFFAPIQQGDKLVYRNRVNHQELLDEFFYQNTIKYGILKDIPYFIVLYYQLYGEGNRLNITYNNGMLEYPLLSGYIKKVEISDLFLQKLGEMGVFDPIKPPEEQEYYVSGQEFHNPTPIERFERRLAKTKKIQSSTPGEFGG